MDCNINNIPAEEVVDFKEFLQQAFDGRKSNAEDPLVKVSAAILNIEIPKKSAQSTGTIFSWFNAKPSSPMREAQHGRGPSKEVVLEGRPENAIQAGLFYGEPLPKPSAPPAGVVTLTARI